ncbi:MAG: MBL fold metallo-hydrolase [Trueperaceae bacterium]|nr:MBL fold metallo-hydrolase [Trueperaceae bacterium]
MSYVSIPAVQDLGNLFLLDTQHLEVSGKLGVYLLPGKAASFALIETGPGSTLETIKAGVKAAGFRLDNLDSILVTHIHLDHAGAAGELARLTGAPVYVHERGAKHMHDPTKLMTSAERIYGDAMDKLWGKMVPILETQLRVLSGGENLTILDYKIEALYTPGHASHHLAYLVNGKDLFTGDVANIRLTGSSVIRPALPPPDIDLELWQGSIQTMLKTGAKRLLLTHFGPVEDVEGHLSAVPERNQEWADEILQGMQEGQERESLIARIAALGNAELLADDAPPEVMERHQESSNYEMTVMGVTRYWQKYHPELLESEQSLL